MQSSSSPDQDDEESGYDSDEDDDDEEESSKIVEKIKETLAKPIEKVKNVASNIKNKVSFLIISNLRSLPFPFRLLLQPTQKTKIPTKNQHQ
jgi:hypothetical protein